MEARSWERWIWNPMNIPENSFICWLVGDKSMLTISRLLRKGVYQDNTGRNSRTSILPPARSHMHA